MHEFVDQCFHLCTFLSMCHMSDTVLRIYRWMGLGSCAQFNEIAHMGWLKLQVGPGSNSSSCGLGRQGQPPRGEAG